MIHHDSIPALSRLRSGLPRRHFAAVLLMAVCSTPAAAQLDSDPANDTQGGADALSLGPGEAITNIANLAGLGNDVDFYSNLLTTGDVWLGMTTPLDDLPFTYDLPDTMISVYSGGVPQTFNDDDAATELPGAGAGRGSLFRFLAPGTGTYHVGVTGYGDEEFDGAASGEEHFESGRYVLTAGRVNPAVLGGGFSDTDPTNDFWFTGLSVPDFIPVTEGTARIAVAELVAGDVDFYELHLSTGQVLSAMTAPLADLSSTFDAPDTRIALFDGKFPPPQPVPPYPYLTKLAESEDAGNFEEGVLNPNLASDNPFVPFGVYGSAIRTRIPADGVYYLAVTGFGDSEYAGDHGDEGRYALLVGVALPEPGSIVLGALGVCSLLSLCRRRCSRRRTGR